MSRHGIRVGAGRATGASVELSAPERSTHLHVVGASGAGKSRFLEYLVRQDIDQF